MLALLLACTPAPDVATYRAALGSGACDSVRDDQLRDDCWLAHLDPADPTFCDRFATDRLRACAWSNACRSARLSSPARR